MMRTYLCDALGLDGSIFVILLSRHRDAIVE
jgi:hypothetical protein